MALITTVLISIFGVQKYAFQFLQITRRYNVLYFKTTWSYFTYSHMKYISKGRQGSFFHPKYSKYYLPITELQVGDVSHHKGTVGSKGVSKRAKGMPRNHLRWWIDGCGNNVIN